MSREASQDKFKTKPLNPTPLTDEDTGDFKPDFKPVKYRHGRRVGKREQSEKIYSSKMGFGWNTSTWPRRFQESSLPWQRPQHCRDGCYGCYVQQMNKRLHKKDVATLISEGRRFLLDSDKEDALQREEAEKEANAD